MERLKAELLHAATGDGPVLVTGEPGSGKSLTARAVHEQSARNGQRCAAVACQALPEALLDIELFGCATGITGAAFERRGLLEVVNGGTVILENVDATSPRTQAALARYLATGQVRSVGATGDGRPVDTRIVATTSAPPPATTAEAPHDSDLWIRLLQSHLRVPSLRDRKADVPVLAQFFAPAGPHSGPSIVFSAEAMTALSAYTWPGNVAQLRQVVERLAVSTRGGQVRPADLPVGIRPRPASEHGRKVDKHAAIGDELFARVQSSGESFWSSIYPLFMRREITRADLRACVARALSAAHGNAGELTRVLNMPGADQQKFERFLRKFGCEPRA
jgi:DNA-binding NtrC family response regulator